MIRLAYNMNYPQSECKEQRLGVLTFSSAVSSGTLLW